MSGTTTTYSIVRHHWDDSHPDNRKIMRRGLTLKEAQAHCKRADTQELDADGIAVWFDGYRAVR